MVKILFSLKFYENLKNMCEHIEFVNIRLKICKYTVWVLKKLKILKLIFLVFLFLRVLKKWLVNIV